MFVWLLWSPEAVNVVVGRVFGLMTQYLLASVPLFIFMASVLAKAHVIEDIYEVAYRWLGGVRGGLAVATIIACTLLAAMTGVIGATEVTMGIIALPEMLKRGYDKQLAIGSILAGGSLGILIPPSILMIVYGLVAQESVGQLYMACIVPGLLLSGMYIVYALSVCWLNPAAGPPLPPEERISTREKVALLPKVIVPLILVVLVLGTMFFGIASPTEAAGMGAFGALLVAAWHRRLSFKVVYEASEQTLRATAIGENPLTPDAENRVRGVVLQSEKVMRGKRQRIHIGDNRTRRRANDSTFLFEHDAGDARQPTVSAAVGDVSRDVSKRLFALADDANIERGVPKKILRFRAR